MKTETIKGTERGGRRHQTLRRLSKREHSQAIRRAGRRFCEAARVGTAEREPEPRYIRGWAT